MSIITIGEHQHLKNEYVCSFCGDKNKIVVGRAYSLERYDYPKKHYMFSYCGDCALRQAEKMVKVAHPKHKVI